MVALALVLGVLAIAPAEAEAANECSPITLESLLPTEPPPEQDPPDGESTPPTTIAPAPYCSPFTYGMVNPVIGDAPIISRFGVDRPGDRKHKGIDIGAPKMTPVVAVAAGTIFWINGPDTDECCSLAIRHLDGWTSWYIHLNNDTAGTDDGLGTGIAPGLEKGSFVEAGQLIGWLGDSGNAEPGVPHLHFEIRTRSGAAVDAASSFRRALRVDETLSIPAFVGPFYDLETSHQAPSIALLTSVGVYLSCDASGLGYCPDDPATGRDVETVLVQLLGSPVDIGPLLERHPPPLNAESLLTADPYAGCGDWRYCITDLLSRSEVNKVLAVYLVGADQTLAPGITDACWAPFHGVTRADLAELVARIVGLAPPLPCDRVS